MTDTAAPTAITVPERQEDGKFLKGVSGNPNGRPKGRRNHLVALQQDLEIAVREHLSVDRIKKIINKICDQAESGNVAAAKLILDKVIASARDGEEVSDGGRTVIFRVENATFGAIHAATQPTKGVVIDAEVSEVSATQSK